MSKATMADDMMSLMDGMTGNGVGSDGTTPICRCRVLYLGSSVPHITKDGLQGIQEPLRDLYPDQGVFWNADRDHSATGIDSWLSVWSNGILVENVDDKGNTVRRFHPIESLHYCAAVRYVSVPASPADDPNDPNGRIAKFLPLDSPFSKNADAFSSGHPPLFACILRRTSGIKVLECHAFICKKEPAANALVRCCFHAYADTMHAKQIENESPYEQLDRRRSRSIGSALDAQSLIDQKIEAWQKNSTGGTSGGSSEDQMYADGRSLSRQRQTRTPSVPSLMVDGFHQPPPFAQHHPQAEPIYNGYGTLRSVKSFMSLATLKSSKSKSKSQMLHPPPPHPAGMPMMHPGMMPPIHPGATAGGAPVMFATLSKKELKKVQKQYESTLKRKHKYKDASMPMGPMFAPGPYGPMMMAPMPFPHQAPPQPHPGGYFTVDRKGRMMPPLPPQRAPSMSHLSMADGYDGQESIYGTLRRPITPGRPESIYGTLGPAPHTQLPPPGPPMFVHPATGQLVPFMPTLSRKELKELEKAKAKAAKRAEKERKKAEKSGKGAMPHPNGMESQQQHQMMPPHPDMMTPHQMTNGHHPMSNGHHPMSNGHHPMSNGHHPMSNGHHPMTNGHHNQNAINGEREIYASTGRPPIPPFAQGPPQGPPPQIEVLDNSESEMNSMEQSYQNGSNSGGGGGIYKKKGHLNERAFSYSIRQEHRSRSNSLSNLAFEAAQDPNVPNGNSQVSLRSEPAMMMNGNGGVSGSNGGGPRNGMFHQQQTFVNSRDELDPAALANRMAQMKLMNGHANGHSPIQNGHSHNHHHNSPHHPHHHHQQQQQQQHHQPPPPPPLPPNGYQQFQQNQKTATIKRL